jgi:hypothetical protein
MMACRQKLNKILMDVGHAEIQDFKMIFFDLHEA